MTSYTNDNMTATYWRRVWNEEKKDQDEPKTPRYTDRKRRGETTKAVKNTYLTYNKAV